ncbi:ankyrin repeat-containing domain protein [Phyllosticta paracitricarpa]
MVWLGVGFYQSFIKLDCLEQSIETPEPKEPHLSVLEAAVNDPERAGAVRKSMRLLIACFRKDALTFQALRSTVFSILEPMPGLLMKDYRDAAETFINHGFNPNASLYGPQTPLHIAIRKNSKSMVCLMLSRKANPNHKNAGGETPWSAYASASYAKGKFPPLHRAVGVGRAADVDFLLNNKINPLIPKGRGLTPLDIAVYQGHL